MISKAQWIATGIVAGVVAGGVAATVLLSADIFPVTVGSTAPAFQAVDLMSGDTVGLADYKSDVVLLNVWATWCAPCEQEIPSLQRLYNDFGPKGLKIVAVSIDKDSPATVREWVDRHHMTFRVLLNHSGDIQQTYQTTGVPETFIIDRQGVIVKKVIGATEWDQAPNRELFRRLLSNGAPATTPRAAADSPFVQPVELHGAPATVPDSARR